MFIIYRLIMFFFFQFWRASKKCLFLLLIRLVSARLRLVLKVTRQKRPSSPSWCIKYYFNCWCVVRRLIINLAIRIARNSYIYTFFKRKKKTPNSDSWSWHCQPKLSDNSMRRASYFGSAVLAVPCDSRYGSRPSGRGARNNERRSTIDI